MDKFCTLLLVGATFSSDVVTRTQHSAGAIQIKPPTVTWTSAGKGEGNRVDDGRETNLLGAKAIDVSELDCNEEQVLIIDSQFHFFQEEPQKGQRRVDSS